MRKDNNLGRGRKEVNDWKKEKEKIRKGGTIKLGADR